MRLGLVVLVLVAGCRLRFDDTGDARFSDVPVMTDVPAGHDEDGDSVPDLTDTCPHVAGDQADGDGDGVGDLCDPEPANNRQRIVLFDPLLDASGFVVLSETWTPTGDALRTDASAGFAQIKRDFAFQLGIVEVGVDVVARTQAAPQHQISLAVLATPSQPYFYVEIYESGTSAGYAALSQFDGTMYMPIVMTPMATGVHLGRVRVRMVAASATQLSMTAEWPAEPYSAGMTVAGYTGGSRIDLGIQGITADLRYMIVIATQ